MHWWRKCNRLQRQHRSTRAFAHLTVSSDSLIGSQILRKVSVLRFKHHENTLDNPALVFESIMSSMNSEYAGVSKLGRHSPITWRKGLRGAKGSVTYEVDRKATTGKKKRSKYQAKSNDGEVQIKVLSDRRRSYGENKTDKSLYLFCTKCQQPVQVSSCRARQYWRSSKSKDIDTII